MNVSAGFRVGGFYNGDKKEISGGLGLNLNAGFQASADWGRNIVDFADGSFTTDLLGVRVSAAFSPKMFLEAFVSTTRPRKRFPQTSATGSFIMQLSDFFIVYTESRPTEGDDETLRNVSLKLTPSAQFLIWHQRVHLLGRRACRRGHRSPC